MKYVVNYHGKKYYVTAVSAIEAIDKISSKKVFGRPLIPEWNVKMVDAGTRGVDWCTGFVDQKWTPEEENRPIFAQRTL